VTTYDVAVIGAGILGLAVARELRHRFPGHRLVILERAAGVAAHQTGHNSGVIHSGVYYQPGSLKARLCVQGSSLMYEYCDAHSVPYERCGKLIIARHDGELTRLADLEHRGHANGVPGLRRLTAAEIPEVEPGCQGVAALHCPSTGIVDYKAVARSIETGLRADGVGFCFGREVTGLERRAGEVRLATNAEPVAARFVIGCAGLWSDRLAVSAGAPADPRIVPFRGAYLTLGKTDTPLVRGLVYPVPDPGLPFLGVHITRQIDGRVVLGPTAMMVWARDGYRLSRFRARDTWDTLTWPGSWRMGRRFWRTGIDEIRMAISPARLLRAAEQYLPGIGAAGLEKGTASGVRAQALGRDGRLIDDFVISETEGAMHIRNAPSPAATSSLALAREVADRVERSPQWPSAHA
jgi:L-2-hydroxyglutarate oxidase